MVAAASIITTVDGLLSLPKTSNAGSYRILKSLSAQILYQLHEITGIEKVC